MALAKNIVRPTTMSKGRKKIQQGDGYLAKQNN
jgi:hypothetical protein